MADDKMLSSTAAATTLPPVAAAPRPTREEDNRIARACAAGDAAAFEELYRRFGERLKSIGFHHLGNVSDAEDAVQETFLKLHRAASSYNGEASLATWLVRILINTCYDSLRRRRRRIDETPLEDFVTASRAAASVDDTKRLALRKLLDDLPEQRRSVFVLFEIEGLSHAEIGQILDITEGNSKWILFATKKHLQEQWRRG
jgi:RNA polymerase sigma-70 factor (ECF subfamily)